MKVYLEIIVLFIFIAFTSGKKSIKGNLIEEVSDSKEFKKILRTKTNVLVCFVNNLKEGAAIIKLLNDAADTIRGHGTMLLVDCSGEGKKMCKKLKVTPEPHTLKHFKDGEFHKNYDRKETVSSLVGFMRDPTGDLPWDEDDSTADVVHIPDPNTFMKFLKKESRPVMVMFYAPWCGFCKQLKPEYSVAATELKKIAVLAAVDVNKPENAGLRIKYNITGFPTLQYFENGEFKFNYEGENKKESIISFMKNPSAEPAKPKEEDWSSSISDVVHLTTDSFDPFMETDDPTLVMFYAPWCGHCKKLKPEYEKAASIMKKDKVKGSLAAVDATKEPQLAKRFGVKSYPTLKFFNKAEFQWDNPGLRDSAKLVSFMKDPKEPPPPPPPEPAWEEQPSEVVHLTEETFKPILKKKRHALVMFYAPWCGHCKAAKPEFTAAAEESKDNARLTFAAIDCTKHSSVCSGVGVSGYPTFKYYNYYNKAPSQDYSKGRMKQDFLSFLKGQDSSSSTPVRDNSAGESGSGERDDKSDDNVWDTYPNIKKLTLKNFTKVLEKQPHSLVMFYHPTCMLCKRVTPQFALAADLFQDKVMFAVVNSEIEETLSKDLGISGFPWFKFYNYYNQGSSAEFSGYKQKQEIVDFIKQAMSSATQQPPKKKTSETVSKDEL